MRSAGVAAALLMLTIGAAAHAAPINLVTNGNFESSLFSANHQFSSQTGTGQGGQGVTGWTSNAGYNLYFFGGTATTVSAVTQYSPNGGGNEKLWGTASFTGSSPTGGNFVALDGDVNVRGTISQVISGLTIGSNYLLSFDWGAGQLQSRTGDTTEAFDVTLGGQTISTATVSNPDKSFTGWFHSTLLYTATSTSEVLTFLSRGTPSGLPPIATLDGVSLVDVPEPASLALLGLGLGAVGLVAKRRRRAA